MEDIESTQAETDSTETGSSVAVVRNPLGCDDFFQRMDGFSSPRTEESGFALLLTIFIVALATILVLDFAEETFAFQRAGRGFTESIQADYVAKSAFNLSKILLEVPKLEGIQEDWLGEPWALIQAAPSLPISGFIGEPRLAIVDESGKININAISLSSTPAGFAGLSTGNQAANNPNSAQTESENYWKNVIRELFLKQGFQRESYESSSYRTLGDVGYDAEDQVAILHDWVDRDSVSHSSASFPGEGIESSGEKHWFYNRPYRALSELTTVPGMTLERMRRIAPFVRVSSSRDTRVNVNTAPYPVLLALGFPETQAQEIIQKRLDLPITIEILRLLTEGDTQLQQATSIQSREFSAYVEVKMPNVTRWAHATLQIRGGASSRKASIVAIETL
jgi:type II secretory pathway component PulK